MGQFLGQVFPEMAYCIKMADGKRTDSEQGAIRIVDLSKGGVKLGEQLSGHGGRQDQEELLGSHAGGSDGGRPGRGDTGRGAPDMPDKDRGRSHHDCAATNHDTVRAVGGGQCNDDFSTRMQRQLPVDWTTFFGQSECKELSTERKCMLKGYMQQV